MVNSPCSQAIPNEAVKTSHFTEDSRFTLFRPDSRRCVYRRRGEHFADACVDERDRFGVWSLLVWGGIAHGVKAQLIVVEGNMTAVKYNDEIFRPTAVPLVQQRQLILQQDNAWPHVARVCRDFLANNNIVPLDLPPYGPDLSPHRAFLGRSGPEVIKLFSCSTQLSTKFFLLINVKMPTNISKREK